MRITKSGLALGLVSSILVTTSALAGGFELALLGATGLAAVAISVLAALAVRMRLQITRTVTPRSIHAGQHATVSLELTNRGRFSTLNFCAVDRVDGLPLVTINLASLGAGRSRMVRYRFDATRRGVAHLGPVTVTTLDTFGLAESRMSIDVRSNIVVLPSLLPLAPLTRGPASLHQRHASELVHASVEDDFSRMREFAPGDDLRRVHWPTTARLGTPQVREHDPPIDLHVVVYLDASAHNLDIASAEQAVSIAATLIDQGRKSTQSTTLALSTGQHFDVSNSSATHAGALEHLALLQFDDTPNLAHLGNAIEASGDVLVVLTGAPIPEHMAHTSTRMIWISPHHGDGHALQLGNELIDGWNQRFGGSR